MLCRKTQRALHSCAHTLSLTLSLYILFTLIFIAAKVFISLSPYFVIYIHHVLCTYVLNHIIFINIVIYCCLLYLLIIHCCYWFLILLNASRLHTHTQLHISLVILTPNAASFYYSILFRSTVSNHDLSVTTSVVI